MIARWKKEAGGGGRVLGRRTEARIFSRCGWVDRQQPGPRARVRCGKTELKGVRKRVLGGKRWTGVGAAGARRAEELWKCSRWVVRIVRTSRRRKQAKTGSTRFEATSGTSRIAEKTSELPHGSRGGMVGDCVCIGRDPERWMGEEHLPFCGRWEMGPVRSMNRWSRGWASRKPIGGPNFASGSARCCSFERNLSLAGV